MHNMRAPRDWENVLLGHRREKSECPAREGMVHTFKFDEATRDWENGLANGYVGVAAAGAIQ